MTKVSPEMPWKRPLPRRHDWFAGVRVPSTHRASNKAPNALAPMNGSIIDNAEPADGKLLPQTADKDRR